MHPLQYTALVLMVIIGTPILAAAVLGLFMAAFPNAVKYKHDSRLIRWPAAIKRFLASVPNFLSSSFFAFAVLFDRKRAQEIMREIETGQLELPL